MKRWTDARAKEQLRKRQCSLLPQLTKVARRCGYAIAAHGSMTRDLDLIAMPWVEHALKPETLVMRIEHELLGHHHSCSHWKLDGITGGKPHGRLGACLLNPGEMGFEPLKPVGEPDAANSRIRFDVRVEALRPSFVAPFPRWRSSAGCECGKGRGPPLGELQDIVGEADEAPLVGDLLDAAQEKLTEAARLLDLSEHRLGQLLS